MNEIPNAETEQKKWIHPEQREGEVFLGNIGGETEWKTARIGEKAFKADGTLIEFNSPEPTFVERSEIEEAIKNTDNEKNIEAWNRLLQEN